MAPTIPTDEFIEEFSSTVVIGENFFKRFHKILQEEYHINCLKNHTLYYSVFYKLILKIRERYPIVSEHPPYRMDESILTQIMSLPQRDERLLQNMSLIQKEIEELSNREFLKYYHFQKELVYKVIHSFIENLYWFKMFDFDAHNDKTKIFGLLTKLTLGCDRYLHLSGGKQNKDSSLLKFILYLDSGIKLEYRIKKSKKNDERLIAAQNLLALSRIK